MTTPRRHAANRLSAAARSTEEAEVSLAVAAAVASAAEAGLEAADILEDAGNIQSDVYIVIGVVVHRD